MANLSPYVRVLAWLLWLANASPPMTNRARFYVLKARLCERYGVYDGDDLQHLVQPCWGTWDWQHNEPKAPCGPQCRSCGGTGIYLERWVRLERWKIGPYLFHRPTESTRIHPAPQQGRPWIEGRITHATPYGRGHEEARLWLYLCLGEWRAWGHELRSHGCCGRFASPMLLLQWVVARVYWKLTIHRCSCGRHFPTFGHGWLVCRRCRSERAQQQATNEADGIPF